MGAASEVLEHTAEVRLRVRGRSLGDLLGEAGHALAAVTLGGQPPASNGSWRTVEVRSTDRDALLVDWLNELIYLAETERWVPVEFVIETATPMALRAQVRGVPVAVTPARVKAATFHGLRIATTPDGLTADVILDV
jgi:SHS2 domain-containing protein